MAAKKTASKTNGKNGKGKKATKKVVKAKTAKTAKTAKSKASGAAGYKGHRDGTWKEQLHRIFDTIKDADKARAAALKLKNKDGKLIAPSTVNTSFSQFRTGAL